MLILLILPKRIGQVDEWLDWSKAMHSALEKAVVRLPCKTVLLSTMSYSIRILDVDTIPNR